MELSEDTRISTCRMAKQAFGQGSSPASLSINHPYDPPQHKGPFVNHMRIKQQFHEFLRKTSVLIDLNFIGIVRIKSLVFQLPGKNCVCADKEDDVLLFQPNPAVRAAHTPLWEREPSPEVDGTSLSPFTKAVPTAARGLPNAKLDPRQMLY